jgi:hypothetical protein
MSAFTASTDIMFSIRSATIGERLIGSQSSYLNTPHVITGKTIQGWRWDELPWPKVANLDSYATAPTAWDPTTSGIAETDFQSGYGDGDDLLLVSVEERFTNDLDIWAPRINHGWYYVYNEEWFLYSDSYQAENFALQMSGGRRWMELKYPIKPGVPVRIKRYVYDSSVQRYRTDLEFRKKVEFTVSGLDPEFTISGQTIYLNGEWNEEVGHSIVLPEDIFGQEEVGISNGNANQEFATIFSPIEVTSGIEVWSYLDPEQPIEWTVIPMSADFADYGWNDAVVKVDYDTGLLKFGNSDGSSAGGKIPPAGSHIVVHYFKGIAVLYEPVNTTNLLDAPSANINPVEAASNHGFVQITTSFSGPARIVLSADLPTGPDSYLISLGNNTGRIRAIVYDANDIPIDGQVVTFELLAPKVGTFGGVSDTIAAQTNTGGIATAIYNSPLTILDVGQPSVDLNYSGADTLLTVSGITDPGTVSGLYTYKVWDYDTTLGIPVADLPEYYVDYFVEEQISGVTATQPWEEDYRSVNTLPEPTTYTPLELSAGKKTILLTQSNPDVIDPHTGHIRGSYPYPYSPLYPSLIENIGTSDMPVTRLTFSNIYLPIPPASNTKSYFVVGDAKTRVRAYAVNRRTGSRVYSNEATLKVTIPASVNGTYFASVLNDIPSGLMNSVSNVDTLSDGQIDATSGLDNFYQDYLDEMLFGEIYRDWFRRTRRGDTLGLTTAGYGLTTHTASSGDIPALIPLGFRLKSSGITLASMLDQVTYIDPNDQLPSGYWPTDWYDTE